VPEGLPTLPWGRAETVVEGQDIAILAFGTPLQAALAAADALGATVVNMRFVKPLDLGHLLAVADRHRLLVTVEENVVMGGAGAGVNEALHAAGRAVRVVNLGLPDRYIEQATQAEQLAEAGLLPEQIERRIREVWQDISRESIRPRDARAR
jgi:1-deoxy-D-xylulose-5-phosphate synthase